MGTYTILKVDNGIDFKFLAIVSNDDKGGFYFETEMWELPTFGFTIESITNSKSVFKIASDKIGSPNGFKN
ncbi:hypothetical protein AB3N59_13070 [Leptospira sp. WS92.C1]